MRRSSILVPMLAAFACREGAPPAPKSSAPPAPTAAAPAETTSRTVEPSAKLSPVLARLQYEGLHRPASLLAAERVLDELERGGLAVVGRRQYLGASMRASYCVGGTTRDGVAVSVCEYPSTKAAADGKRFMDEKFKAMEPRATRTVRESTVLSVATPRADGTAAERAINIFAAMTPQETTQQQENL